MRRRTELSKTILCYFCPEKEDEPDMGSMERGGRVKVSVARNVELE